MNPMSANSQDKVDSQDQILNRFPAASSDRLMKTTKALLPALALATLAASSCVVAPVPPGPPPPPVAYYPPVGYGYYNALPVGFYGDYYFYGGRYYYGGRWSSGHFYHDGRYYSGRYFHNGHYYYGGRYDHRRR